MEQAVTSFDVAKQVIRSYLLGPDSGSTVRLEWFRDSDGHPLTLNQIIQKLKAEDPDAHQAVAHLVAGRIAARSGNSPLEQERRDSRGRTREERQLQIDITDDTHNPDIAQGVWDTTLTFDAYKGRKKFPTIIEGKKAVKLWAEGRNKPIVVLTGAPGVGKTHLVSAAANYLTTLPCSCSPQNACVPCWQGGGAGFKFAHSGDCQRCGGTKVIRGEQPDLSMAFRTESEMMGDIRHAMGKNKADDVIEGLKTVRILIIDELGRSAQSDTMAAVEDEIIDARWANAGYLRTLIGTNLLSEHLPPRIASRLGDTRRTVGIVLEADDFRRAQK